MRTYLVIRHFTEGGHSLRVFTVSEKNLQSSSEHECDLVYPCEVFCEQGHDLPPILVELESGEVVDMEPFPDCDWRDWLLEKMQLHEQENLGTI